MPMKEFKNEAGEVIETRMMTKEEILAENIIHREDEVMQYQINIDNFTVMIAALEGDSNRSADDEAFLTDLNKRIGDERREQRKAQLVLNALRANLGV